MCRQFDCQPAGVCGQGPVADIQQTSTIRRGAGHFDVAWRDAGRPDALRKRGNTMRRASRSRGLPDAHCVMLVATRSRQRRPQSRAVHTEPTRIPPARPLRAARRDDGITRLPVQGSRSSTQPGRGDFSKNRGPLAHPRSVPSTARFHRRQRLPAVSRSCFGGRLLGTTAVERSGSGRCTGLHPEAEELGRKVEDQ
jgi:hypothetical protein